MIYMRPPDDIEQYLIDGRSNRAILVLMARSGLTRDEAREIVGRWMSDPRVVEETKRNRRR